MLTCWLIWHTSCLDCPIFFSFLVTLLRRSEESSSVGVAAILKFASGTQGVGSSCELMVRMRDIVLMESQGGCHRT